MDAKKGLWIIGGVAAAVAAALGAGLYFSFRKPKSIGEAPSCGCGLEGNDAMDRALDRMNLATYCEKAQYAYRECARENRHGGSCVVEKFDLLING